jgi:hypothetical protein
MPGNALLAPAKKFLSRPEKLECVIRGTLCIIKFITDNSPQYALNVGYNGKYARVSKYEIPGFAN